MPEYSGSDLKNIFYIFSFIFYFKILMQTNRLLNQ